MKLMWEHDGRHWPHHAHSRFVESDGLRWHVQVFDGPASGASAATPALLLHGTGASSHSWRGLAPLIATERPVLVVDLPGHGFTPLPSGRSASMPAMAQAVSQLMGRMGMQPGLVVGHSAGAAIAVRMALDRLAPFDNTMAAGVLPIVSLNGALLPLHGVVFQFFSPVAKLLAAAPGVPDFVAWRAQDARRIERLLEGTGSTLDAQGQALYARLVQSPDHVAGALRMMADWDLPSLERELPRLAALQVPLHLVVGERDATVPPSLAARVQTLVPQATLTRLPALGHLAHEEAPAETWRLVQALIAQPLAKQRPLAQTRQRRTKV
jgi:magnesium chelatase accessory protein